jgi:hypothetical protein
LTGFPFAKEDCTRKSESDDLLVERLGDGRESSPFRYTLAGRKFEDEDVLPPLHEAMGTTERELFERCKRAVERVTELDARFSAEQE